MHTFVVLLLYRRYIELKLYRCTVSKLIINIIHKTQVDAWSYRGSSVVVTVVGTVVLVFWTKLVIQPIFMGALFSPTNFVPQICSWVFFPN